MAYQYIDTLSIPNEREIDAVNNLLDTLLGMVLDGDLEHHPLTEALTVEHFATLGVETFAVPPEGEEEEG